MIDGTQKNKHCSVNLPRKSAHMHTHTTYWNLQQMSKVKMYSFQLFWGMHKPNFRLHGDLLQWTIADSVDQVTVHC